MNDIINLKCFTYEDYLVYLRLKKEVERCDVLKEDSKIYEYGVKSSRIIQPHDKLYKTILDSKKQVAMLINRVLNLGKKLKDTEIEKYNSSFIDNKFKNLESDIVYKKKNQNIFFLIEHQSKVDINMPRRILEYEVAIMQETFLNMKKNEKLPLVVPIVIYTGSKKWNVAKTIQECQERLEGYEKIKLGEYYILDINDYKQEELKNAENLLFNIFALEKLETLESIFNELLKIVKRTKDESEKEILSKIIYFIYNKKLGNKKTKELLKILKEGGSDSMIFEVIDREIDGLILKGKREGIKEGMKEGMKEGREKVAIEMIKMNLSDVIIKKATKFTQKHLDELKKKVLLANN